MSILCLFGGCKHFFRFRRRISPNHFVYFEHILLVSQFISFSFQENIFAYFSHSRTFFKILRRYFSYNEKSLLRQEETFVVDFCCHPLCQFSHTTQATMMAAPVRPTAATPSPARHAATAPCAARTAAASVSPRRKTGCQGTTAP